MIRSGPLVFLSSVDGLVDHRTGAVDHAILGDGPAQAARAYRAVVERLEECGLGGSDAVRIEHATASQDWRLQRMALWPEHFGTPTQAVSQGYQGKMADRNMITVTAVATVPGVEREVITPGPNPGRASRISRCGPFLFIIGVRGETSLDTGEAVADVTGPGFADHVAVSYANIDHHLAAAQARRDDLVRLDAFVRRPDQVARHDELLGTYLAGQVDVSCTVVACPLGGSTDLEVSAIAAIPGTSVDRWAGDRGGPGGAQATSAAGFVFASGVLGDRDGAGRVQPEVLGRLEPQLETALGRLEGTLDLAGSGLSSLLRLDVYLSDPYQHDAVDTWLARRFDGDAPTIARHGVELGPTALVGLSAVAAASSAV